MSRASAPHLRSLLLCLGWALTWVLGCDGIDVAPPIGDAGLDASAGDGSVPPDGATTLPPAGSSPPRAPLPSGCGDGQCDGGESCVSCPSDCGPCVAGGCGDGVCGPAESCSNCPADCAPCVTGCGDGVCDPLERCDSCPLDCGTCEPVCGDGICEGSELCSSCPVDCGLCFPECGDGVCDANERCDSCPRDCGECLLPPVPLP